jgi:Phospholipase_D-nuclease N-terminal
MIVLMGRLLLFFALVDLAVLAVALIDCLSSEKYEIRALPRWLWVLLIVLFSPAGPIAWFMTGRPKPVDPAASDPWGAATASPAASRARRQIGPDDDPEFLRSLGRSRPDEPRRRPDEPDRRPDEPRRRSDESRAREDELLRRWEEELRRRDDPEA